MKSPISLYVAAAALLFGCSKSADTQDPGSAALRAKISSYPSIRILRDRVPSDLEGAVQQLRELQRYCLYAKQYIATKSITPAIDDAQLEPADKLRAALKTSIEEIFSGSNYSLYQSWNEVTPVQETGVDGMLKSCAIKVEPRKSVEIISGCKSYNVQYGTGKEPGFIEIAPSTSALGCPKAWGNTTRAEEKPVGAVKEVAGTTCILISDVSSAVAPTPEEMKTLSERALKGDAKALEQLEKKAGAAAQQLSALSSSESGRKCYLEQYPYYAPLDNLPVIVGIYPGEKMKQRVEAKPIKQFKPADNPLEMMGFFNVPMNLRDFGFVEEPRSVEIGTPVAAAKFSIPADAKKLEVRDNSNVK
jgi:hypothetical protein